MRKIVLLPLLCLLIASAAPARASEEERCHLPVSIGTSAQIRRQLATMIQRSPTFRQQCQRLDVPRLSVQIRVDAQIMDRLYRARTTITRSSTGTVAWVSLAAYGDNTEWLAHEFEHIIEQLDGVNLPKLAFISRRDAWCIGDNMYESDRALRVGKLVVKEVRAAGRLMARALKSLDGNGREND